MPGTDLSALARQAGMSWDEFRKHNPAYRSSISPPNAQSTAYVPRASHQRVSTWLAQTESTRFAGWQNYRVRRGDTLYALSNRYGVPVNVLRQANNINGDRLSEGATLLVPGTRGSTQASSSPPAGRTTSAQNAPVRAPQIATNTTIYTVQRGDTLFSIARAHGLTVNNIQEANGMRANDTRLVSGQKLNIPVASSASNGSLVVRSGDTLYRIALQNNTSVDELIRLNNLQRNQPIMPGQEIRLP
jgi:membrane-bound lytic murein transglycosylase D